MAKGKSKKHSKGKNKKSDSQVGSSQAENSKSKTESKSESNGYEKDNGILDNFSDFSNINKDMVIKVLTIFSIIILIGIAMYAAAHFRLYPDELPMIDEYAENRIHELIWQQEMQIVQQSYPNLPENELESMAHERYQAVLERGQVNVGPNEVQDIDQLVSDQSEMIKQQFRHDAGNTYLLGIDSYFFYRSTKNYIEDGNQFGAVDEDGKYYDPLILGGLPEHQMRKYDQPVRSLHIYMSAWLYHVMSFFNNSITVMGATFYIPIVIAGLSTIPAFFIGRRIAGNLAGFFSALLIAIHPAYLNRTPGGFTHTEGQNILFPLLIVWFFFEALNAKNQRDALIWSGLCGLAMGLFSFAWTSWYFMPLFIFGAGFAYLAYLFLFYIYHGNLKKGVQKNEFKNSYITLIGTAISSFVFVNLITDFSNFMKVFGIFDFTQLRIAGITRIWPNIFTTVAELNPITVAEAISQVSVGSKLLFFLAVMGFALPMVYNKKGKMKIGDSVFIFAVMIPWAILLYILASFVQSQITFAVLLTLPIAAFALYKIYIKETLNPQYSIMLLIWFAGTLYATSNGVRFVLLMVPAFSLAAGIAAGIIVKASSEWISKNLSINRIATSLVLGILIISFAFLVPYNTSAYSCGGGSCSVIDITDHQAKNHIPSMNDGWYDTLVKIRDESSEDAIINSWWDFGHWFIAIAERRVTLDGGRQNRPQAHWLGKLMLTEEEEESVGILRYLDCGANYGFDLLLEYMDESRIDHYNTITLLYETLPIWERQKAKDILMEYITEEEAEDVLQYTHCENPPENYFITSEDMVGKAGVWAHFGAWDFERASMFNLVHNNRRAVALEILEEEFNVENPEEKYDEIMNADADQWVSPWPRYHNQGRCQQEGDNVICQNSLSTNTPQGTIELVYQTQLNLETEEVSMTNIIQTSAGQELERTEGRPKKISFVKDGEFITKEYDDTIMGPNNREMGIAIYPDGNSYRSVMMDSELTASIFTRLFFFENQDGGLKHFDKFHQTRDANGQKIIVWKVDWPGEDLEEQETAFEI